MQRQRFITTIKSVIGGGGTQSLIDFIVPLKSTTTVGEGSGEGKKKSKRHYRTSQNIRITNVFPESLLLGSSLAGSHSPPHLPRMPSNTVLVSVLAVGAAQILIWSYSCVFLPPMSTAIRTSVFSFVFSDSVDTESA